MPQRLNCGWQFLGRRLIWYWLMGGPSSSCREFAWCRKSSYWVSCEMGLRMSGMRCNFNYTLAQRKLNRNPEKIFNTFALYLFSISTPLQLGQLKLKLLGEKIDKFNKCFITLQCKYCLLFFFTPTWHFMLFYTAATLNRNT